MTTFGAPPTTDEVLHGVDLTGKHVMITGASAGLGVETTRALAAHGASVTMAVRDRAKAEGARDQILATVPHADLELRTLDLASQASIRAFTEAYLADGRPIDVFIGNAGIMACPHQTTEDGFEMQFGTNHLGHWRIVRDFLPRFQERPGTRVVLLSSSGHRLGDVDLEDWNFERADYDPWVAYGRSKTANVLTAIALDHRLAEHGSQAFAVHPGFIVTELGRHMTRDTFQQLIDLREGGEQPMQKTVEQGAATSCYAATSSELDGVRACFLEDCGIAEVTDDPVTAHGVRAYALDPDRAEALWSRSEELVG